MKSGLQKMSKSELLKECFSLKARLNALSEKCLELLNQVNHSRTIAQNAVEYTDLHKRRFKKALFTLMDCESCMGKLKAQSEIDKGYEARERKTLKSLDDPSP